MGTALYILSGSDNEVTDSRLTILLEKLKREGLGEYRIFSEVNDKRGRKPLKESLKLKAREKEYDTFLLYNLSDWESSPSILAAELTELVKAGIRVVSITENFDSITLTGRVYLSMMDVFSEFESNNKLSNYNNNEGGNKLHEGSPAKYHRAKNNVSEATLNGPNVMEALHAKDGIKKQIQNQVTGVVSIHDKNAGRSNSFDLIGLDQASAITGYSRNTLYQLTSKKLIPHFKRPNGRRLFFSKRALEEWLTTGNI